MKKSFLVIAAGFIFLVTLFSGPAISAPINLVDYASLTGIGLIDFEDLTGSLGSGTNYDNIFESGGADFGEHFLGQTVTYNRDFDIITGLPTGGFLSLEAGAKNENLNIFSLNNNNIMSGVGNKAYPDWDAIGEGAFSVLFDYDQSEFGFQLIGGNNGVAVVDFYRRDASLIDTYTINLSWLSHQNYGFTRDEGVNDIAGITIYNNSGQGVGFDNLI